MQVAFLQFRPKHLEVDRNLERVETLLSGQEADLVVLPELFTSGYFFRSESDLRAASEPIPNGPSTQRLLSWARELDTTLVAGIAEQAGEDYFNSAVIARPDGRTHVYRKVHLFFEETTLFSPGDMGFPVFEIETREGEKYTLGVMVCFDWYFPEAARTLALKGADVIAHPSNLVLPHCPDSMPIRARENHVYTVTANRFGTERKGDETLTFIGLSEICSPDGEIVRRAKKSGAEVGKVDTDSEAARKKSINAYNDILKDRRPDAYART